ncbi:MAG TPA: RNA polymerase sigma factor [Solirubrobacteraceae bacterium]|jgi:RNA polymerase sigma factor (sigma-70 family)|nr:RNA polymerase sigma factor [Solirubrobacteraceae bacterium]
MSDIALPIHGASGLPLAERLLSDERLAKLAGRGDARAFTTLYERHHQAIYRYCRSIVRNDHDAQDALQSAMARAYMALCASERDLAVRPWLFRIAHNEAISILRRRPQEDQLVDVHESLDSDVERTAEERERLCILLADLQALPERQRAALLMRELSGLSIEEIAGALSVSTGAAKQTLFEARSSLHEFAKGRAMECEAVRRAISERDGRVLRGRGLPRLPRVDRDAQRRPARSRAPAASGRGERHADPTASPWGRRRSRRRRERDCRIRARRPCRGVARGQGARWCRRDGGGNRRDAPLDGRQRRERAPVPKRDLRVRAKSRGFERHGDARELRRGRQASRALPLLDVEHLAGRLDERPLASGLRVDQWP